MIMASFVTGRHFAGVVLEAPQRGDFAGVYHYLRADYIDAGAALDHAALHKAAGDGTNFWHLEGIP